MYFVLLKIHQTVPDNFKTIHFSSCVPRVYGTQTQHWQVMATVTGACPVQFQCLNCKRCTPKSDSNLLLCP